MVRSVTFRLFLFLFVILGTGSPVQADAAAAAQQTAAANEVSYDRTSDQLNVLVAALPLKRVLGRIAQQSGIEVMFDDKADEPVSFNIQSDSLEAGLKRMLKGRNYMLRYDRDEHNKLLLIGVMVLPVGEQDSGRARRLVAMDDEAYYRARSQLSVEQVQQMDRSMARWQARLSEMPAERRQRLEKRTEERVQQQIKADRWYAEQSKKIRQLAAEQKARRLAQHELAMKQLDPERRAAFERDSEEARLRTKALIEQSRQK